MVLVLGCNGSMNPPAGHRPRRTIVVDDDVFRELQKRAEPLVDDENSVLRRVLRLDATSSPTSLPANASPARSAPKRPPRGSLIPQAEYELPILEALDELGGSAPAQVVVDLVGRKLRYRLTEFDLGELSSGPVRWENRVAWARSDLVKAGLLKDDSPIGIWEIAEPGRERLAKWA